MNIVKLHHIAEQRCKSLGCQMKSCQEDAKDPEQCQRLHRELLKCIKTEKDYLIERYERTGKFI